MSFTSPEWWGVNLAQGPGEVLDDLLGGLMPSRGRPDILDGVPWVDGGSWVVVGPPRDEYGSDIADAHPYVVLARRFSSRADGWGLESSTPNTNASDGPVVLEWTPNPDFLARSSTDQPGLFPLNGSLWTPPLTWRGITGTGPEVTIAPTDALWMLYAPIRASEWSGGTLRIADGELGAQTLVEFVPFELGEDTASPSDPYTEALGQYELLVNDDAFNWVVWLTHSDAAVSDGSSQTLVRDSSPYHREIRSTSLTRTAQIEVGAVFGNAIQIGDRADARVRAIGVDPSLNFRGRQFTMEARVSRKAPSHPLTAYSDCCLFYLGSWSFVITARGSLAIRRGKAVRVESGAVTVLETATGLIDMATPAMALRTIALTRNASGICTIWLDGQAVGSGAFNPPSSTDAGLSGPGHRDGLAAFTRFDEVRWTNGLCRYTEPYTPSTQPFPDVGGDTPAPPGAVIGLAMVGASSHSLSFDWSVPLAGGDVTGYMVEWALADTDFAESSTMTVTATAATLNALPLSTRYDVRVYAYNDTGPGQAVTLLDVSTTALAVASAPTELALAYADYYALSFFWTPPDDMGDGAFASYVIEAALGGTDFASPIVGTASAGEDGSYGTGQVEDLQIGRLYDVRVAAVTSAGRGAWATSFGNWTLADPDANAVLVDRQPLLVDGLPVVFVLAL